MFQQLEKDRTELSKGFLKFPFIFGSVFKYIYVFHL